MHGDLEPLARTIFDRSDNLAVHASERRSLPKLTTATRGGGLLDWSSTAMLRGHLQNLSAAMLGGSEHLFADYVRWLRRVAAARQIPPSTIAAQLSTLYVTLRRELSDAQQEIGAFFLAGLDALSGPEPETQPFVQPGSRSERYLQRLLSHDRAGAMEVIRDAMQVETSVHDIYLEVIQPAQRELGRLWELNRISVADEHFATTVSQEVLARLYPHWLRAQAEAPRVVVACVEGDLHELGARMVADFFEMAGWHTTYLGANTPVASLVEALLWDPVPVLALSITMASSLGPASNLIESMRANPRLSGLKILVGGRPFIAGTELWRRLGADSYGADADAAIRAAEALVHPS